MKQVLLIALVALALATLAGSAAAENAHAYNGSYCKAYFGSQAADFYHQYNGTYNASNGARYIACPVLVDEIANTTGSRVFVYWTANAATDQLYCNLYSLNENGTIRQGQTGIRTGTGWMFIPNMTSDNYWGSYSMYCYLPSHGNLQTIWLGEND